MIGVFDSGIGGLTVLKSLLKTFPESDYFYLGDTARLPYGAKTSETIRRYSEQVMRFLLQQKVEAIVIACNSASSFYPEDHFQGIPVFNVITPGAESALQVSQSKRIGILGTRATVNSKAYDQKLKSLNSTVIVVSQACPLFVPLAEEGWVDDPITNLIVYRYMQPLLTSEIDTLILGCTHYPLLRNPIQKAIGNHVKLVDGGEAIASKIQSAVESGKLSLQKGSGQVVLGLTDSSENSIVWAQKILSPLYLSEIKKVDL
jgi:glutamate racemase